MNKSTVLVLLFVLCVGMAAASSADMPSPLAQYNSGVPIQEIQCKDSRILMETSRGIPVCVYDRTVDTMQHRGWTIVHILQDSSGTSTFANNIVLNESETITVQSGMPHVMEDRVGTIRSEKLTVCHEAYTASLTVPRKAVLDEPFDVTMTFSFTDDKDKREFWEKYCDKHVKIRHPANYVISGDSMTQGAILVDDYYTPPIISRGKYVAISLDQQPITFQMSASDPAQTTYGSGPARGFNWSNYDLSEIPLFNGGVYDYGYFGIYQSVHYRWQGPEVYTSIRDGFVTFHDEKPVSGQSEDAPQRMEYTRPLTKGTDYNSEQLDIELPFETMHDILQDDNGLRDIYTVEEIIKAFGHDDDYVQRFLRAYPEYRFQTQSFLPVFQGVLPSAFAASPPPTSRVTGTIQITNPDGNTSGVYGVNVCAGTVNLPIETF